ncbi:hypothetical protein EDC96DRAFT_545178 [Choanephora cucurbitarum]|nr:hypothetical protein EDC96DRAFT_545178 [Choanephora cucurbitarum]
MPQNQSLSWIDSDDQIQHLYVLRNVRFGQQRTIDVTLTRIIITGESYIKTGSSAYDKHLHFQQKSLYIEVNHYQHAHKLTRRQYRRSTCQNCDAQKGFESVRLFLKCYVELEGSKDNNDWFCWIHHDYNITARLGNLRRQAIALKSSNKKLTAVQKLMLNHVYFVFCRKQKSVTKFLPFRVHSYLNNFHKNALPIVPNVAKGWVEKLKQIQISSVEDTTGSMDNITKLLKRKTLSLLVEADQTNNDTLLVYANILNDVVLNHRRWCQTELAETMFISFFRHSSLTIRLARFMLTC